MNLLAGALTVWCALGAQPALPLDDSEVDQNARWLPILDRVATEYTLKPKSGSTNLVLVERATYKWARSGPHGGTYGGIYVWVNRGCAEAVACFWRSAANDGKLAIAHELHSLSPVILSSDRDGAHPWEPTGELERQIVTGAPVPAPSAPGRLQQMRAIGRDFSARTVSSQGERTELRLLPQPLYRYQSSNPDIVDGGLFAFVCSVGTDPEVFLLLEATKTDDRTQWRYALARFSHLNLFVDYKDREVWQAIRGKEDTIAHSADNTYWLFHEPFDSALLDAARAR